MLKIVPLHTACLPEHPTAGAARPARCATSTFKQCLFSLTQPCIAYTQTGAPAGVLAQQQTQRNSGGPRTASGVAQP